MYAGCALANAQVWAGRPLSELLAALSRSGVEVLYSSELVPREALIETEPRASTLTAQVAEALTAHGLVLQQLTPGHYVVARRAPHATNDGKVAEPASPANEAPPERLDEVAVYASRFAFDRHGFALPSVLSRRYIAEAPGARTDVLRAAQTLPGIAMGSSARPYIRGSLPEDVLVVFDHLPIADPFHLKKFQRLISVFDSSVIDRMDVYSGAYPVQFGTRSGGVIDLAPRSLATGHEHGIDVGLQSLAVSSVGHADGRPLDWLVATRANVVDLAHRPVVSGRRQSDLLDFVGRLRWQPGDTSTWIAGALLMNDHIQLQNQPGDELATTHSSDAHAWLAYEWQAGGPWRSRTALSLARDELLHNGSIERQPAIAGTLLESRDFFTASLDTAWTWERGNSRWRLGGDLVSTHGDNIYARSLLYSVALANAFNRAVNDEIDRRVNPRQLSESAFASWRPVLAERLETELGLRYDAQQVSDQISQQQWSPRLNLRYHLSPQLDIYGSWGKFSQAQRPDEWRLEEGQVKPDAAQVVTQGVVGVARNVDDASQWRIEVYHKLWSPVIPYFDNLYDSQNLLSNLFPDRIRIAPQSSLATGVEFSLRRALRPQLEWWGSASVAQVTDTIDGRRVARSWDQRWSASTGLAWTHERFSMLGSLRSHAGWPRTPMNSLVLVTQGEAPLQAQPRNTRNWNSYVSADLRAAWTMPLRSGSFELWAELTNASNRDNKCCLRLTGTDSGVATRADTISWQPRNLDVGFSWRMH